LNTVARCGNVEWILVTKRPELWAERVRAALDSGEVNGLRRWAEGEPPGNVTVLASVEDQRQAEKRITALLRIPAKVHGLSLEPLLGPVVLTDAWLEKLRWLVIGGESGVAGARDCNLDFVRILVGQGKSAKIPVFVKQLGARPILSGRRFYFGGKGGDFSTFPDDLKVREFPYL
jgi:protein gp37